MDTMTIMPTSATKEKLFPVSEIYGPVAQGEGALIGLPTVFLRFGGCDFRCSWCDSLYAVLPKYAKTWERMSASAIADKVTDLFPEGAHGHVTYSGGNPAIHAIDELVQELHTRGVRQAVETQGTVWRDWLAQIDDLTLSPKPPSSGNITPSGEGTVLDRLCHMSALRLTTRTLKIVVFNDEDYEYATLIHRLYQHVPMVLQVGTDVGHSTRDDLLAAVDALQNRVMRDAALFDVAVLPQMHVVLRGHARGI